MTYAGTADILVVGGGQAAFTLAISLRSEGFTGSIRVLSDEAHVPYQRPPLTKAFLSAEGPQIRVSFQDLSKYVDRGIAIELNCAVTTIDRELHTVRTADGRTYGYGHLVLATGARNRRLADVCPGGQAAADLRTLDDAAGLRARLVESERVVVIGAGFLGLEFATSAVRRGARVTVLEIGATLMGRVVSEPVAAALRRRHEADGVDFRLSTRATGIEAEADDSHVVVTDQGERLPAQLVVGSIGVVPNDELAVESGLDVRDGIVVDAFFATSDPAVSAIGDCASFALPLTGEHVRLESVQNAVDGARCLARRLTGQPERYRAVPWFWSDQAGVKLQIAGVARSDDVAVVRGDSTGDTFSVCRFRGNSLVAVESLAAPADHMAARRLLADRSPITAGQAADTSAALKEFLIPA